MIYQVNTQKKTVLVKGSLTKEVRQTLNRLENLGYKVLVAV